MNREMVVQVVEGNCPFAKRSGMRLREYDEEEGRVTLVMEDDPANFNSFGLIHAGAICGLAETVGGMAIFRYLNPLEILVLNTIFNIRYTIQPRGELSCTAQVTADEARALLDEFRSEGKADKAMDLKVRDAAGTVVAQAQATYRLIPTPDQFKPYFGG